MNRSIICVLILAGIAVAACSSQAQTVASPAAATSTSMPLKSGTFRFAMLEGTDVKDVPWFMALDSLKEQGYTTEVVNLAKTSLIPPALERGDADLATGNTNINWAAVAQGADIATIVGKVSTSFFLVTSTDIDSCSDLDGKVLTFATRQSVGYVMFEEYIDQHCAGTSPEIILISGSSNRVAGLEVGEVDGAYLELEHWLSLQQIAPGEFHVLINFAKEFPEVQISTFSVRREWAEQNREQVEDFIRALLLAYRGVIADPELLRDGIVKHMSIDAAQAEEFAEAYLLAEMWDPNGQLSSENVQATLDFLSAAGMLPADLRVEDVADLSYLNAVLDEIGRQ